VNLPLFSGQSGGQRSIRSLLITLSALVGLLLSGVGCGPGSDVPSLPVDAQCKQSAQTSGGQASGGRPYLSSISMQNETMGWGVIIGAKEEGQGSVTMTGDFSMLHTSDGGCHWKLLRAWKRDSHDRQDFIPFFISPTTAWVEFNDQIYSTSDSGAGWITHQLPIARAEATKEAIEKSKTRVLQTSQDWMVLWQTRDGGQHWTELLRSRISDIPGSPFPYSGTVRAMYFLNETTGWITLQGEDSGSRITSWIITTHDGGRTWQKLTLIPPGRSTTKPEFFYLGTPRFFSQRDGLIPVVLEQAIPKGISIFITHDGGASWHSTPLFGIDYNQVAITPGPGGAVPAIYLLIPEPYFVDMNTGWIGHTAMFQTSDGGQHWQRFDPHLPLDYLDPGVQFLTKQVGWALQYIHGESTPDSPARLYKTRDGGKTWTWIPYSVS
jgi:photosystem II stability/assembly factor-like uncharacterized protein